jgi:transposase
MTRLTEIQKFEIIVNHYNGMSIREITNHMNVNAKTVNFWLLRYKKEGNLNAKYRKVKINQKINS